jgi:NADH-quinone oxidoreductase subunit C/D
MIDVSAVDRSEVADWQDDSRFHTVYQLRSYSRKKHLTCRLSGEPHRGNDPVVPSLPTVYEGANWPEREVWDLMGVRFNGHPDHRRILMPENWPYHPLRKKHSAGRRRSTLLADLERSPVCHFGQADLPSEKAAGAASRHEPREHDHQHGAPPPQHPRRAAPGRGIGRRECVNVDPDLGYLHSGFEKTGENKRYKDFVYYTDRMDYLSGDEQQHGLCAGRGKVARHRDSPRATVIRVIMSELQRIASHLFWLSTHVLHVCPARAFAVLLMYATRERERILDLFEMACGARLTVGYMRVGGVSRDIPPAFLGHLEEFLKRWPCASTNTRRCSPAARSGKSGCAASAS